MPDPDQLFLIFTRKLEALDVRYMVTGSVASIYYGEPRFTSDVDIVLILRPSDASAIVKAFPSDDFYCPPIEVVKTEMTREQRGHFNIIHHETGFKADVYLGNDDLHRWGLAQATPVTLNGESVRFAPPEYVILRKLEFFREGSSAKHLRDIDRMLDGLGTEWDRSFLLEEVKTRRLSEQWQEVVAFSE